jgi:hypothetical protein
MLFRVVNGGRAIEKGVLTIDLVKSRTRVRWVKVKEKGITWQKPEKEGDGYTSSIQLQVATRIESCPSFQVRVDYEGGPPVVGGIRHGEGAAARGAETPATRRTRREGKFGTLPDPYKKYYQWFTEFDQLSDEDLVAAAKKPEVSAAIAALRSDLQANLAARATGARTGDDALVCSPEFTDDVAVSTLSIYQSVFTPFLGMAKGLMVNGACSKDLVGEITGAFFAFCQGDLRVAEGLSDLNAEPDSAMVFLFAEYALTLLQVVDQFGPVDAEGLDNKDAKKIAEDLFKDKNQLETWKRVAASFVLGQRAYMRVYGPRRTNGPARFEDYVRTNFDPTEKLEKSEVEKLQKRYAELGFTDGVLLADPVLRNVYWRHAMNAVEAFPGALEEERSDELGNLMLPAVDRPDQTATVALRPSRGADATIRRHVRHEVASMANVPTGIASTDTLGGLGFDDPRLKNLAAMLAAYASVRRKKGVPEVDAKALEITAASTVDSIALKLNDLIPDEMLSITAVPR